MAIEQVRLEPDHFRSLLGLLSEDRLHHPGAKKKFCGHIAWLQQHAGIMERSAVQAEHKVKVMQPVVAAAERWDKERSKEPETYSLLETALHLAVLDCYQTDELQASKT